MLIGISLLAMVGGGAYFSLYPERDAQTATSTEIAANGTDASIKGCSFATDGAPSHSPIIMNEIAWMGNASSTNDEWIELKNISSTTAMIGGWELVNLNEKIKVAFRSGAKIPADGFYLLERGSSDFLPGVKADNFFTSSLKNNGDSFRLFDDHCGLIDEIISTSSWLAGENAARKTMERDGATLLWHTSAIVGGTPGQENTHIDQSSIVNGRSITVITSTLPTSTIQPLAPSLPSKSNVNHILISQVQITGGPGKTDDDFIEIYNPTAVQFNLKGYRLVKRTHDDTSDILIKSWTTDAFIPAYGFYLWANSGYTDTSVAPDATTSESISDDNGIAIRHGANDTGAIIDSVAWGKAHGVFVNGDAFPVNPGANQSLFRKGWQNGVCLPDSTDITLGNGCDIGNSALDFELMNISAPRDSGKI